jgi:hypothetical protein
VAVSKPCRSAGVILAVASRPYISGSIGTSLCASPHTRASCDVRERIAKPTPNPAAQLGAASTRVNKSNTPMPPKCMGRDFSERVLRDRLATERPTNTTAATSRVAVLVSSRKVSTVLHMMITDPINVMPNQQQPLMLIRQHCHSLMIWTHVLEIT